MYICTMSEMTIIGGRVSFEDEKELNDFLNSLKKEDAIRLIETALDVAVATRTFDMKDAYVLYKCILTLKENED